MGRDSIKEILWQFPLSGREKQLETLTAYFEAKKTQSKVNAADTVGIHHTTATSIEETYEELTQQEKTELNRVLLHNQIEDNDQPETGEKAVPAQ